jgi:hypothetical protein
MPRDGYESVSIPDADYEQAGEYKPPDATWGDCLVAGAERLNDSLESDTQRFGGGPDNAVSDEVRETLERLQEQVEKMPARTADELEGRMR